ncbi:hypothetical protein [Bradyrhizobium sp. sBnM-33]|uniref:hypothetical protein n=1 Tax=Bradyrhizobium sp. sBnM-33 TaxID=2831780 RepID=UPI00293F6C3A|nr:hypothetical protein [Bradyrhizobium sp. sBnM-33]WOH54859.1 hypothetical protein RX328_11760 [Bradyrhizobium sp. sBnM-33]
MLQAISDFLDDQKDIIDQVRCDLTRGLKKAETGRSGLTPQQVLPLAGSDARQELELSRIT